jgi:hypothetical protein
MNLDEISVELAREMSVSDPESSVSKNVLPQNPFWHKLVSLGHQIPEEEWAKLPTDLSQNFEHYMYGAPKE